MSELGFYHPDRGYWQAIAGDAVDLLKNYPKGTIVVPLKPGTNYEWHNGAWVRVEPPPIIPTRVSANQFGKQLVAQGLLDQVKIWVAAQDEATQWSFQRSATFVRDDPMMQAGFAALGFTSEQIDEFFVAASKL